MMRHYGPARLRPTLLATVGYDQAGAVGNSTKDETPKSHCEGRHLGLLASSHWLSGSDRLLRERNQANIHGRANKLVTG